VHYTPAGARRVAEVVADALTASKVVERRWTARRPASP
jgi:hypothetical protein